jgi:hypothetical protein
LPDEAVRKNYAAFTQSTDVPWHLEAMKKALPFFLLLAAFTSRGQAPISPSGPTHADSVASLHRVFASVRRNGRLAAGAAGLVLGVQALTGTLRAPTHVGLGVGVGVSALYAYFLSKQAGGFNPFSRSREADALRRLDAHQAQPLYIQHRLDLAAQK